MRAILILSAALLTGCAGMGPYEAQVEIAKHRAAEAKSYADAMWQIAGDGDSVVKAVAAVSLAGRMQGTAGQGFTLAPSPLMQAAQIVVPALTQAWAVDRTSKVQMHMSDNSMREALGLYGTFERFAGEINSPAIVTQPAPVIVQPPAPEVVVVPPTVVQPEIVQPVIVPGGM